MATQIALQLLPDILPFMHIFTQQVRCQTCKVTASSLEEVSVRRLAQGHLNTQLGGAGDRTSNLPVTSQPSLTPKVSVLGGGGGMKGGGSMKASCWEVVACVGGEYREMWRGLFSHSSLPPARCILNQEKSFGGPRLSQV